MNPERTANNVVSKRLVLPIVALIAYLSLGLYVVPANQKAVVRRFGRVILPLGSSGLHYDLPWPFSRVDRINLNEVRTLTLGDAEADPGFLQPMSAARPVSYFTGDKNLLLLRLTVQYRISDDGVIDWLYRSQASVERLQLLVESLTADLVSRCGVDFVHTQGLAEFNNRLLQDVRRQARELGLGCEIEQTTIDRADPPARVKAEFLDVSNARADMARTIDEARAYSEQKMAESQAEARRVTEDAERERRTRSSTASGSADRFSKLVAQIEQDAETSGRTYAQSRQFVMGRMTLEAIRDALSKSKVKIMLDGDRPFDLAFPK